MVGTLSLQLGIPGGPELLIILLIAVLLFGANKIPKLARSTGEAMGEFQKGREEVEQELQSMREGVSGDIEGDDAEVDSDAEAEAEADADADADVDADEEDEFEIADAEGDTDAEVEAESESETDTERN